MGLEDQDRAAGLSWGHVKELKEFENQIKFFLQDPRSKNNLWAYTLKVFIMLGVDHPKLILLDPLSESARRYFNRRVHAILKKYNAIVGVRCALNRHLDAVGSDPEWGHMVRRTYGKRIANNFLILNPTHDWVME